MIGNINLQFQVHCRIIYRYGSNSGDSDGDYDDLIYATFSTPTNSISGSAVCAFRLQDITDVFNGPFKEQRDMGSNWMPVPEHKVFLFSRFLKTLFKSERAHHIFLIDFIRFQVQGLVSAVATLSLFQIKISISSKHIR